MPSQIYEEAVSFIRQTCQNAQTNEPVPGEDVRRIVKNIYARLLLADKEIISLTARFSEEDCLWAHSVNVSILSMLAGMGLGYEETKLEAIGIAGLLHDIGMIKVAHIIQQPGSLTDEQHPGDTASLDEELAKQPFYGVQLLERIQDIGQVVIYLIKEQSFCRNPLRLPEELDSEETQLKEYEHISRLADIYENLTHPTLAAEETGVSSSEEIIAKVLEEIPDFFQNHIVRALIEQINIYPLDSWVELNTGQIGKMVGRDEKFPLKPVVQVLFDAHGHQLLEPELIDLSRQQNSYIIGAASSVPEGSSDILKKQDEELLSDTVNQYPLGKIEPASGEAVSEEIRGAELEEEAGEIAAEEPSKTKQPAKSGWQTRINEVLSEDETVPVPAAAGASEQKHKKPIIPRALFHWKVFLIGAGVILAVFIIRSKTHFFITDKQTQKTEPVSAQPSSLRAAAQQPPLGAAKQYPLGAAQHIETAGKSAKVEEQVPKEEVKAGGKAIVREDKTKNELPASQSGNSKELQVKQGETREGQLLDAAEQADTAAVKKMLSGNRAMARADIEGRSFRDPFMPYVSSANSHSAFSAGNQGQEGEPLKLRGILKHFDRKVAIINDYIVKVGDVVEGQVVTNITDNSVTLKSEEDTNVLSLEK